MFTFSTQSCGSCTHKTETIYFIKPRQAGHKVAGLINHLTLNEDTESHLEFFEI